MFATETGGVARAATSSLSNVSRPSVSPPSVALLGLGVTALAIAVLRHQQNARIDDVFEWRSAARSALIERELHRLIDVTVAYGTLFGSSETIEAGEFDTAARRLGARSPAMIRSVLATPAGDGELRVELEHRADPTLATWHGHALRAVAPRACDALARSQTASVWTVAPDSAAGAGCTFLLGQSVATRPVAGVARSGVMVHEVDANALVGGVLGSLLPVDLGVQVSLVEHDGAARPIAAARIESTPVTAATAGRRLSRDIDVDGTRWRVECIAGSTFDRGLRGNAVLVVGLLGVGLSAACTAYAFKARRHLLGVEATVAHQHAKLADWAFRYEAATRASGQLVYDWDLEQDSALLGGAGARRYAFGSTTLRPASELWRSALHPADGPAFERHRRALIDSGGAATAEYRVRGSDGSWSYVRDDAQPIRGTDGRVHRLIGFVTDVTAIHDAERVLQRSRDELERSVAERTRDLDQTNRELEASNRELEAFSYSVSHDLRAPLRALQGFANILIEDHAAELSPDARRCVDVIASSAARMNQLTDDLLRFSRLSREPLSKRTVATAELVREAWQELTHDDPRALARLELAELPPVEADPRLLKQVLINLLGNALKFSRHAEDPRVSVDATRDSDGVDVLRVRDNGVGFDPRYAGKLFGVFQRLHHHDEFEGTGVGLALVRRIVERHGGRIWAESEPGRGATFSFTMAAEGSSR